MDQFNFNEYLKNNLLLKEEQEIKLTSDLHATMASDASKKLMIPRGEKVSVVIKRFENEPKVMQLDYKGKKVNVNADFFISKYLHGK